MNTNNPPPEKSNRFEVGLAIVFVIFVWACFIYSFSGIGKG